MSTTENGWSDEWPKVQDTFYWMRWRDGRYRDLPVHVAGIHVMCLFDHSYLQRGDIEGKVEFLGPISPSDFEQLAALRNAAEAVAVDAEFALLTPGFVKGRDVLAKSVTALRRTLRPELASQGEES